MSRISFNERRLLNRVRKLENRIGILSELCELRAGQEAEKISERYQERERGVLRELAGAEYERMSQPELEHTLTQHRQQAEREKFQKLQADAAMAGIVISRERQEELHKSLQRKLDGIAEEVRRELAAAGAARAGGDLEELRTEAERRIKSIRAEAEAEAQKKRAEVRQSFSPRLDRLGAKKAAAEEKLRAVTGADIAEVGASLSFAAARTEVIARVPVIPGFNHTEAEMEGIFRFALSHGVRRVDLLPYHTLGRGKYAKLGREYALDAAMLTKEDLLPWKALGESLGLDVGIGG